MSKSQDNVFSVIETIKGAKLSDFLSKIYEPEFWIKYIPLKNKILEKPSDKQFYFDVGDEILLDITGTFKIDFKGIGNIYIEEKGQQGSKGYLWDIKCIVDEPQAEVLLRIRIRDLPEGMKVGIFVTKLEFDLGPLSDLGGREAAIFAGRAKLRESISLVQKDFN